MGLADSFLTCKNSNGLVSLSTLENACVLAFPDEKIGHVKVVHFNNEKKVVEIPCHTSDIASLKLS